MKTSGAALVAFFIVTASWGAEPRVPVIPAAAAGRLAAPAGEIAAALFAQFDLTRPECREFAGLLQAGQGVEALEVWRDGVVARLRARDLGEYGWHDYARHPRSVGSIEALLGRPARDEYLKSPMIGFVDIYGMTGLPGQGKLVNWYVNADDVTEWGEGEAAKWDRTVKQERTGYPNFEFAKSFVAKYWETGDAVYVQKAVELFSDFSRNQSRGFWETYYLNQGLPDKFVWETMHCDWRLNTNGLEIGWRMKNFLKVLGGFAKCAGPGKPAQWGEVLEAVEGVVTREQARVIRADQLAEIALGLQRDHVGKLLWFTLHAGSVPNQRAEGLKALAFFSAIFPEFRTTAQLNEYIERAYDDFLSGNFAPDGGSLEQSFNYNGQDKEGLEEVLNFYGADRPRFAEQIRRCVAARRTVDDALQTPLGSLPQVGNAHDVLGKNVWENEQAAAKYWAAEGIEGRRALQPQQYGSVALPYSGFYAMRSGWGMKDLYLFFMNGRPQSGHSMRDNNAIQMTAYGRQLLVCGGVPTYGVFRTPEAKGADFYLSEASSLKNNTVLVDGRSQSKSGPQASRAYETPVKSRWHTSAKCDLVDGLYDLGYGDFENNRDVRVDMGVKHYRRVVFVKPAKLWLVEDRMIREEMAKPRQYTQVWNFAPYCEDGEYRRTIAGFKPEQFELRAEQGLVRTTDPAGPNVELRHFGPKLTYAKYHGNRDPWLGWYAAGIGDARPAVDVHVNWDSAAGDTLLTLLVPLDKGQQTPVTRAEQVGETGLAARLAEGGSLRYETAAVAREMVLGAVKGTARSLLVCEGATGVWGVATGCTALAVGGKAVQAPSEDFEFVVEAGGKIVFTPIFMPEVPVIAAPKPFLEMATAEPLTIVGREGLQVRYTLDGSEPTAQSPLYQGPVRLTQAGTVKARYFERGQGLPLVATREYRPWAWSPREADVKAAETLQPGWRADHFEHEDNVRIYDLMLRKPLRQTVAANYDISEFEKSQRYGMKWTGYLKIPRDGVYHFTLDSPVSASLFIHNPAHDLQAPAIVRAGYWKQQATGSAALRAGYHQVELQYLRAWKAPNRLVVEVEGPGLARQALPVEWLWHR